MQGVRSHGNDRYMWQRVLLLMRADLSAGFKAAHDGHLQVHEHSIKCGQVWTVEQAVQALLPVGDELYAMSHIGKHADGECLIDGVVFGQQEVQGAQRLRCPQQGHAGRLFFCAGQIEFRSKEKRAASACLAIDPDVPAEACHEAFANGEAETGAAVTTCGGGVCLREALENQVQFVCSNAYARVIYGKT